MEKLQINKDVNVNTGLTKQEVSERTKKGLTNKTYRKTTKSYAKIIFSNFFTFFNIVCFTLAGILIAVHSYKNVMFIGIFLCNLFIGLIQEIRAKRMVDKISVINNSQVEVLRDGEKSFVSINNIVKDDIIFIKNGDQICADCVVIDGDIEVNESLLTGESRAIKKHPGDTLFAGSYIISGVCKAMAVVVGYDTYSSKLITKAKEVKSNKSDILKTLNAIIKSISFILLPLGILTYVDLKSSNEFLYAVEKTAGSIIGMMPAGMFLLTSVSLVVGVINLAKKKTLVQDLYSIEMLARTDVLCLDKTGTLTDGTMTVKNITPLDASTDYVVDIMQDYVVATKSENSTSKALSKYFWQDPKFVVPAKKVLEFNSERKFSAVEFEDEGIFMLGAPEFVSTNISEQSKETIAEITKSGYRVLLLCKSNEKMLTDSISKDNRPLAFITIQDNIRSDAKSTIEWFNMNGVQVKIISGDNVNTVSNISKKVGVVGYDKCISLEDLSNKEVEKAALEYNVFGRVTPEQKSIIVKALKSQGKKVAMTGDGVNDILALKEADCSIAMASGSEATRSASNLIMMENSFSSMPSVVAEGRRVINNISKASALFLTKTFFSIFLTIFVLLSPVHDYPLQPNQILLWETLFIGIPAFFLALQPCHERVSGSFLAGLSSNALPGAIVLFLNAIACYIYAAIFNCFDLIPTLISYAITFGAFFILLNLCLPLDKYRGIISFGLLAICIIAFAVIPKKFFDYHALGTNEVIFLCVIIALTYFMYALLRKLFNKIFAYRKNKKAEKTN